MLCAPLPSAHLRATWERDDELWAPLYRAVASRKPAPIAGTKDGDARGGVGR